MTIPTSTVTDLITSTGGVLAGLLPLIIIIFGIGIAFYIIKNIISMLPKG